jgi:hypothetical protein
VDRWHLKRLGFAADLHIRALNIIGGKLPFRRFHFDFRQFSLLGLVNLAPAKGQAHDPKGQKFLNIAHNYTLSLLAGLCWPRPRFLHYRRAKEKPGWAEASPGRPGTWILVILNCIHHHIEMPFVLTGRELGGAKQWGARWHRWCLVGRARLVLGNHLLDGGDGEAKLLDNHMIEENAAALLED